MSCKKRFYARLKKIKLYHNSLVKSTDEFFYVYLGNYGRQS